jgi:hypothetical protein
VYNRAEQLLILFRDLEKLDPQPDLYIFAENNSTDNTLEVIREFSKNHPSKIIRLWLREDAAKIGIEIGKECIPIAHVCDLLLTAARNFNPDYAICIDSDMEIQSTNLITILTGHQKDIVGTLYQKVQLGECRINTPLGIVTIRIRQDFTNGTLTISTKEGVILQQTEMENAELTECATIGIMCSCLSRRIIQDRRLCFYPLFRDFMGWHTEDMGFCLRARSLGYQVWLDKVAIVEHKPNPLESKPWDKF